MNNLDSFIFIQRIGGEIKAVFELTMTYFKVSGQPETKKVIVKADKKGIFINGKKHHIDEKCNELQFNTTVNYDSYVFENQGIGNKIREFLLKF